MSNDTLDQLSDARLSEVFAVEVAGWKEFAFIAGSGAILHEGIIPLDDMIDQHPECPSFSTDANAVLPWLDRCKPTGLWVQIMDRTNGINCGLRDWLVVITNYDDIDDYAHIPDNAVYVEGASPIFPRAACIALIKATRAGK